MEYCDIAPRRPGRPRVIPEEFVPIIIRAYKAGSGYRAISHYLENEGITASLSTVRRLIKEEFRKRRKLKLQCCYDPIHRHHPVCFRVGEISFHTCLDAGH